MPEVAIELSDVSKLPAGRESFWNLLFRRSRYVVAIAVSAVIFMTLGWQFASPPADYAGLSLLGWAGHAGLLSMLALAVLLIVTSFLCTLLIHPDSPHTGLFCALLGMSALAIRGGTSHMLIQHAQSNNEYPAVSLLLGFESIQLGIIVLVAEMCVRELHHRFFSNTHWITRSGAEAGVRKLQQLPAGGLGIGVSLGMSQMISRTLRTNTLSRLVATPLAVLFSMALSFFFLYEFLQSQATGQVMFACMAAFFIATLAAYMAFPGVPALAFILAVPLTAAVGYWYGRNDLGLSPGQGGFFINRALPIHFITTGIPGAILGYYWGFSWALHTEEVDE